MKGDYAKRTFRVRSGTFLLLALLTACSGKPAAETPASETSARKAAPAAGPTAEQWLDRSRAAAASMSSYGFELQMTQELGQPGDAGRTSVRVDMTGRAEREPFKLDQTIDSVIDGQASTLRTIVTPEAYYMYLPEFEEWSRLSKKVAAENRETLSEFQARPEKAIERIRGLGSSLSADNDGKTVTISYEGDGTATKLFAAGLLRSSLGLTGTEEEIAGKLEVEKLKVIFRMDAARNWPLSYRIETEQTVELEPKKKTSVNQVVAGTYDKPGAAAPIVVPKEALEAPNPDELGELPVP